MSIKKTSSLVMFVFVALAISTMIGCDKSDDAERTSGADTATASLPAGLFLAAAPDSPVPVKQVKAQAKEGDEVVVRVVAGGEVNVFVDGRAIAKVVDAEMENLCLSPDDNCRTPWDYCCAASEELQPHRATVRVVDAEGKTIKVGLKGAGQIEELKTLIVKGVVAKGSDRNNLVIDARGIYVEN
jgi:antitoxin (DNA-binding transcriptional repressor) of toxin-antitoxin stability system